MTTIPLAPPRRADLWAFARKAYKNYYLRVIIQTILTIWAVTTFTFILIREMPGNPVDIKIEQLMTQRNMSYNQALNQAAGLYDFDPDAPLIEQYLDYLSDLLRGDLGQSITAPGTQVNEQIARYLPWTLFSVGTALFISFTAGIFIGMAMAYWRGSVFDNVMTTFASIIYGIPDFIIALMMLLILGVQLKLFPLSDVLGEADPDIEPGLTVEYVTNIIQHAILPITTYVLASIGGWMLTMKSSTVATLGEDYITVAQARGLSERRILTAYIGRNAMLPLVTRLAISIGFVMSGSVIVEVIFRYPGLGQQLASAIVSRDYTTMQGVFLVITVAVVISNMLADFMYAWLDPRVRLGGRG